MLFFINIMLKMLTLQNSLMIEKNLKMKKITFLIIILLVEIQLFAQIVSEEDARKVACNFLGKQTELDVQMVQMNEKTTSPFFIFNTENSFVIVSADKRFQPILAYSYQNSFDKNNISPAAQMWLDYYSNAIAYNNQETQVENATWEQLLKVRKKTVEKEVAPLLNSHWGQGKQYNYYCPKNESGPNGRCVTGCVPTALAQVMNYFRFPTSGEGSYGFYDSTYGQLSVDFSQSTYDFSSMTDQGNNINISASSLIADIGVACDIVYGPNGSGMYNHKAAYAMRTFFKYSPETEYIFRDSVNLNWDSLLVWHLDRQIPLYYAGWSVPNIDGHGFVCDGYQKMTDGTYYYHFNFGWDGSADGYFYTNALSPQGHNFNLAQEIIAHAYPDTSRFAYPSTFPATGTTTLTSIDGSFEASGFGENISQGTDYKWIIAPDADSISKIVISGRIDLAAGDTLWLEYNNNTTYFVGEENINIALTNQKTASVRLVTNSDSSKYMHISYSTTLPNFCQTIKMFTSQSGTISDGSGNCRYNNFTSCKFRITINGKTAITVKFKEYDLAGEGDSLRFYDLSSSPSRWLMTLSATSLSDSVYVFNTNKLMVDFTTDEQNVAQGWCFDYVGGTVDVGSIDNELNIIAYPNPSKDNLFVEIAEDILQTMDAKESVKLYDMLGKLLMEQPVKNQMQFDMSHLSAGIYFLKISNSIKKIVKE